MSALNKISVYLVGLAATFVFLLLIKIFNVSYPLNLLITNTTKSSELAVVGEGKVDVVPDTVYVELGISVSNVATAEEAQKKIDEVNNKVIDALKNLGVDAKDIQTSNYNINPNYNYLPSNENKITGYNGNATVNVKLKDAKLATQVINEATKAGANQVMGNRFVVDDPAKYREVARNKAIENAKEQAAKLSKELGISLGKIVNIVESNGGNDYPMYARADIAMPKTGGGGPQLEPGTQTVTSTVTLFFEKK
ncbi:SIMPL domain-containing protein [Candidatus Gottesmanbacteria bacterium]|nr:SIMPL domain-containing protein [Candidatus Gottesmanbacteria bacterium]